VDSAQIFTQNFLVPCSISEVCIFLTSLLHITQVVSGSCPSMSDLKRHKRQEEAKKIRQCTALLRLIFI
jgi:hypothetical protein